ncbi:mevalonate kinase [Leuconostoc miyukkimchii]|uniref:mevalonate kinase n=1 Tax=Leuconostoc miyukkimchii TaxID=910540 RepID=UPI001C7DB57B|nr:mevalonate kinase [Leuconostoc miyukkimchii]
MISQMIGVGIAHAKIILIGEHAVVYGQPAIAIPLTNLTVTTTIRPAFHSQTIESSTFHGDLDELGANVEGLRQLILRLLTKFKLNDVPLTIAIDTNIPQERGFGASAAFATSITKAFFDYVKAPLDAEELKYFTDIEESISHGSASGLDAATVGSSDPIWFIKHQQLTPFTMSLTGTLVVADTGIHGQTMHAVNIVKNQLDTDYELTWQKIVHLGQIASKVRTDLTENNPVHAGLLFTSAHHELQSLGISHPKLDNLVNAAIHAGALGAKLTGAGIGGAMFALAKNNDEAITIANALTKAGAQNTWIQPL